MNPDLAQPEPLEYTYFPDRCPSCGTSEGGALPALLCGPVDGLEIALLTALCPACIAAVNADDFGPVKRALELILPVIEDAELSGGVGA
jgi:hypothetical protein